MARAASAAPPQSGSSAEGGRAAIVDLDLERAEAAAAGIPGCIGLAANVSDDAAVAAAVAAAVEQLGGIDLVLAAAGHAEFGPIAEWDSERFNRMLEVHVGGTFNVCKHTLPVMKARGRGSIVTIASTAAFTANGNNVPYGAAKAGDRRASRGSCASKPFPRSASTASRPAARSPA